MRKLGKIFIAGLACVSLVGCGKIPTLENGEEAVVTTNDSKISVTELYSKLKEKYGNEILVDMIDKLIFDAKYETTTEETAYITEQIASLKDSATQNNVSYTYLLNYYGFDDEAQAKEYLSLSYRRENAVNDYLKEKLTDKEIDDYYNNSIYGDISAKHILIAPDTTDDMTNSEKEAKEKDAYNKAKEIIQKLNDGASWDDLAKEYSTDTSNKDKGGDLGWFAHGDMVTEFENAARALEKGTYSKEPVKTTYGYHIIYKTDEKDKPSKEDSLDTIKDALVSNKLSADSTLYNKTLETIRKDAGLDIVDDDLSNDYKDYMKGLTTSTTTAN